MAKDIKSSENLIQIYNWQINSTFTEYSSPPSWKYISDKYNKVANAHKLLVPSLEEEEVVVVVALRSLELLQIPYNCRITCHAISWKH